MSTLLHGIGDGLRLILHGDRDVVSVTLRTLRTALLSTAIATALGLPLGCLLGLGRFRGRRVALAVVNAGIRLPPVALGQIVWLVLWPRSSWGGGPLGGLHWIYTLKAVVLAQTLLVFPIVVALVASALQGIDAGLIAQADAFGATTRDRVRLALGEARVGVIAAILATLGTAIASVGAILVVGYGTASATLATAALASWDGGGGDVPLSVAYGTVLLGLFLAIAALLTAVQQRGRLVT